MVLLSSHLSSQPHGVPARALTITPDIAKQLARESQQVRKEFRKRIRKMWHIPPHERRAVSR